MFGDGTEDCAMIDAIRCRPNALLKNQMPLPVASIVDTIKQCDSDNWHSDDIKKADFIYIDAGEPLDDPLEALPYLGPNWYSRPNAHCIIRYGKSKGQDGKPRDISGYNDIRMTFTASHHEPANALVKPNEDIEHIITETVKEQKIDQALTRRGERTLRTRSD